MSDATLSPVRFAILLIAAVSLLSQPAEDRSTITCADGSACVPAVRATGKHACCTPASCTHNVAQSTKTCIVRTQPGTTLYADAGPVALKFDVPAPFADFLVDQTSLPRLPQGRHRPTLGADAERAPPLPDLLSVVPTRAPPLTHASV